MLANHSPNLVLASASPRRMDLLFQIGIVPARVTPANIDETPRNGENPKQLVARLSVEKAIAVSKENPGVFVLGADTVVACGRRILSKAQTLEQARKLLKLLSGRRHRVIGGLAVISPEGKLYKRIVETHVAFKRLSFKELELYLESREWEDKAGAYAIQGLGSKFIRAINGSYSNVVGLPLYETAELLHGLGFDK